MDEIANLDTKISGFEQAKRCKSRYNETRALSSHNFDKKIKNSHFLWPESVVE